MTMRKFIKYLGYALLSLVGLLLLVILGAYIRWFILSSSNLNALGPKAPILNEEGFKFRDLNKNGKLDLYEDSRLAVEKRVEDLLSQMNLEEKAGCMFIQITAMNSNGTLAEFPSPSSPFVLAFGTNTSALVRKKMNHFNLIQSTSPQAMALWYNNMQSIAEKTRLGIPVTLATDPRHIAQNNIGASVPTPFFSKWCGSLGFAAIGDTVLMREFGDIARQEYRAVGFTLSLSPMADLATEPRWARINGTFGEDAELAARLTKAYILGFQGDNLGPRSVACMSKHFSGGGPQKDGEDAHFPYGSEQVYPGNNFDYHLIPFEKGVFPAGGAQIMPYYGIPVGQTSEDVGFGYNRDIITGLLREKYGFEGIVCTDWGLVSEMKVPLMGTMKPASAHGVEELSELERVAKILEAGCDMFGGESSPKWIISLVQNGTIPESRIDVSVRRILRDKFRLGLFDNPYVDVDNMPAIGNPAFFEKGRQAQRKSLVLLKNEQLLPLDKKLKVYIEGMNKNLEYPGLNQVSSPHEADVIIKKLGTPYTPRNEYIIESFFQQGRLDFPEDEKAKILDLMKTKPTIAVMNLQRPTVFPEINAAAQAVIADFDCEDTIILELIFGEIQPQGKLPFELPASVKAVEKQKEDLPYDSEKPLYPFGAGLSQF